MEFAYKNGEKESKVVAELYKFANGPELCLAVDTKDGRKVWFYPNGEVSIQGGEWGGGEPIKKFYPGDSITITF